MVLSDKVFTPQEYLEKITGSFYLPQAGSVLEGISLQAEKYGYDNLWDYPLSEIDHILGMDLPVVLVECSYYKQGEWVQLYRWIEVPEECVENFKED